MQQHFAIYFPMMHDLVVQSCISHAQRLVEAIAQEFFFHNENNFYAAQPWKWFEGWANAYESKYQAERARRPDLDLLNYFAEVKLGWSSRITCDDDGCHNMVSNLSPNFCILG